jgi:hypothetical protein
MLKDAYYFPHDSNAKDDPKCMLLIDDLGMEGYGIYWVLIELLRDQPNYKYGLCYIKSIARKYNTTEIKVKQVITGYGLFEIDDIEFYSLSLIYRMEKVNNLRKIRSEAGKKGNAKRWGNLSQSDNKLIANQSQTDCKKSQSKVKESKENKNKENKNIDKENNCIKSELLQSNNKVTSCNEENNCKSDYDIQLEWFDTVWKLYPRKEGKHRIIKSKTKLKELYKDKENVEAATINYAKKVENTEKQFIKKGSTFYNDDYLDFISVQDEKNEYLKNKYGI